MRAPRTTRYTELGLGQNLGSVSSLRRSHLEKSVGVGLGMTDHVQAGGLEERFRCLGGEVKRGEWQRRERVNEERRRRPGQARPSRCNTF